MRKKASIYNIASNHARAVESELGLLRDAAKDGQLHGISYATTTNDRRLIIGTAGNHADREKAISALFRAAVSLANIE